MAVPILLFVLCLCGGAIAGSQWLPDLDAGPVGGLAFFVVCGLLGLALALCAEHIYSIVVEIEKLSPGPTVGPTKGEVVAGGLRNIATDGGTVLGLAFVVYLLAPRAPAPSQLHDDLQ